MDRPTLCEKRRRPHDEHVATYPAGSTHPCPGWPEPESAAGRAAVIIEDAVMDALHEDASGLDDGVAVAVRQLVAAGLLA